MRSILKAIENGKILVSDGGWGTFLHSMGLQAGECPELWNITHPDKVLTIPKRYIEAGSNMVLTNTFGAHPYRLKHYDLQDKAWEINEAGASISREAAGDEHLVLGSIGPSSAILMMQEVPEEEIYDGFRIQVEAMAAGGVDAICVETMSEIAEAVLAIKAAKEFSDLEVVCTFTYNKTVDNEYKTMMGVTPKEMIRATIEAGADVIGANCGLGFDQMMEVVSEIREINKNMPLLVHANAGMPEVVDSKTVFPETPEMMSPKIKDLVATGVNIVGGCCGTTPEHISAFAAEVRKINEEKGVN